MQEFPQFLSSLTMSVPSREDKGINCSWPVLVHSTVAATGAAEWAWPYWQLQLVCMQTIKLSAVDRKQGAAWSWTCLLLELKTKKKKEIQKNRANNRRGKQTYQLAEVKYPNPSGPRKS